MFPYDTFGKQAFPCLWLRIINNLTGLEFEPFAAVIDTGAEATCIPYDVARKSGARLVPHDVELPNGKIIKAKAITIPDVKVQFMDIKGKLIREENYDEGLTFVVIATGLLGRDVLNRYNCEFNGPAQECIINW